MDETALYHSEDLSSLVDYSIEKPDESSSFGPHSDSFQSNSNAFSLKAIFSNSNESTPTRPNNTSCHLEILNPEFLCFHRRINSAACTLKPIEHDSFAKKLKPLEERSVLSLNQSPKAAKNLPIFGFAPCTAYCDSCRLYVHTQIEFKESSLPKPVLNFLGSLLNCCKGGAWINDLRVHMCSKCKNVLAKID